MSNQPLARPDPIIPRAASRGPRPVLCPACLADHDNSLPRCRKNDWNPPLRLRIGLRVAAVGLFEQRGV